VKIIGVSGLGPESPLTLAGKSHVEAFLKKPFTTEELLTALHTLLTR
jgi:DNA-binding response OmpR family regulator